MFVKVKKLVHNLYGSPYPEIAVVNTSSVVRVDNEVSSDYRTIENVFKLSFVDESSMICFGSAEEFYRLAADCNEDGKNS